jgi:hypothetical protein
MIRRCVGIAAIALGLLTLLVPAADASTISRPTSNVFTGPNALAQCRALGQWEVANNGWDGFGCKPDPAVGPTAIQLWVVINTS